MTTHNSPKTPAETGNDAAPHWLSRSEKVVFRAIAAERRAAGFPLSSIERDIVADYSLGRTRVRQLHWLIHEAFSENSDLERDREYVLSLLKELDRAAVAGEKLVTRLNARRA